LGHSDVRTTTRYLATAEELQHATSRKLEFLDCAIGTPAIVVLDVKTHKREFHGIVTRIGQKSYNTEITHYFAEIRPKLWFGTHRKNSRIFQKKTTKEIINIILAELGYPHSVVSPIMYA